jgi:hypothetical protein
MRDNGCSPKIRGQLAARAGQSGASSMSHNVDNLVCLAMASRLRKSKIRVPE